MNPTGALNPQGAPAPWGSRSLWLVRGLGLCGLVGLALTVWLGLWITPPDKVMGDLVRLVYLHPPIAWVALYLAFGIAAVSSVLWLWPRTRSRFWDRLAVSAMEVGVLFTALTLLTGSLWGRPTWGVYWAWDARLTFSALFLVLQVGYLALRRVPSDAEARARRSAIAAIIVAVDWPLVVFSVDWWNSLHQQGTVLNPTLSVKIHGAMAWTLLLGFVSMTLLFLWMLVERYRIEILSDSAAEATLGEALAERWAEGDATLAARSPESPVGAAPVGVGPVGVGPVGVGPVGVGPVGAGQ